MQHVKNYSATDKLVSGSASIWRRVLVSVFGAAERLHRYRDARDVLLRSVIIEQERRICRSSCDEPSR